MIRPELVGRPFEITGELFNGAQISTNRAGSIVSTLELFEHQFSKMGHRDLLVTAPYRKLSDVATAINADECTRVSVCRFGFVQVGLCQLILSGSRADPDRMPHQAIEPSPSGRPTSLNKRPYR